MTRCPSSTRERSRYSSRGWSRSCGATARPGACASPPTSPRAWRTARCRCIAVGTPPGEDGSADLQHVLAAARNIGRHMDSWKAIVTKSTVPVGTADKVRAAVIEELEKRKSTIDFTVVSNPEFLKEGAAVRGLHAPGPHHHRRRGPARAHAAAPALRAVPAQPRARDDDGRALRRAHQVRRQRDAGDAHLVHERDRQPRRGARRRHRGGAPRHRLRSAHRLPLPLPRGGLRRLVLPEGRAGAAAQRDRGRPAAARARRGGPGQRRAEARARRQDPRALRRQPVGQALRPVGARLQAEHRRHARGAQPHA